MDNGTGKFNKENQGDELKVAVNSMQRTAFVERMAIPEQIRLNRRDIIQYDIDNLYPNKAKSIAERSGSTMTAIETLSSFITGAGFEEETLNEIIINNEGQLLFDILRHVSNEKSMFKGFAIHVNYNILGQVIELNEISFENLRFKHDLSCIIWAKDWRKVRGGKDKNTVDYFPFNPENVQNEINEVGIDNYNGQILYWIPRKKDVYTLCSFDSVLDDAQFQAESKLWKLSNVQNGYSSGYIFFYPAQIESTLEKEGLVGDIRKSRGSANAGKTKAVPLNASAMEALGSRKMIEEIPRTGVDKLFTKQNEEAKFDIYARFQQPPILNGITKQGGFSRDEYIDSFDFYNSFTETHRNEVERMFTKLLSFSIWNITEVKIKPKQFIIHREIDETTEPETTTETIIEE